MKGRAVGENNKTVRLKYQDEAEAYSDFKVNVNFTPAPQQQADTVAASTKGVVKREWSGNEQGVEESTAIKERYTAILAQLVDLLQQ